MVSRATVHTKAECIEAIVISDGNLRRAGLRIGTAPLDFGRDMRRRFGLSRRVVRDVIIIEDRTARLERL